MKISARNALKGTVKKIIIGAVSAEVILELPGGDQITSIVTKEAVDAMQLKEGGAAYAVIKATNVLLGTE